MLGILTGKDHRQAQLVENLNHWAISRGIPTTPLHLNDEASKPTIDWSDRASQDFDAIYIPLNRDLSFIQEIPAHIPIILDWDYTENAIVEHSECFKTHKIALRRAFGGKIQYTPQFQVPYLHLPLRQQTALPRDIIMFDVHRWLARPWHYSLLALMAQIGKRYTFLCNKTKCRLKFYFTSFCDVSPYAKADAAFMQENGQCSNEDLHGKAPFDTIRRNTIPPSQSPSDFHILMSRSRLFITDNGEIADQDIIHAGSLGTPIAIVPRNPLQKACGITSSLIDSIAIIEPRFPQLLKDAENKRARFEDGLGLEHYFCKMPFAPWNRDIIETAFLKSWDLLWKWSQTGERDPRIDDAIHKSSPVAHHINQG